MAERWYANSALEDLLGVKVPQINEARLYRGLDTLLPHKDRLCQHLLQRYKSMFGVEFEFLLYDVTSTYFEGKADANPKAQRGYSPRSAPRLQASKTLASSSLLKACLSVTKSLPATPTDVTTVEEMVTQMEIKYGQAHRIWVMDRGMISEENLSFLRQRKARYIVGAPQGPDEKKFEKELLEKASWTEVQPGVEVRLVKVPKDTSDEPTAKPTKAPKPDKTKSTEDTTDKATTNKEDKAEQIEQYVLCRSSDRQAKEEAMLNKRLTKSQNRVGKAPHQPAKKNARHRREKTERRIGRIFGQHSGSAKLLSVELQRNAEGSAIGLTITSKASNQAWAELANGAYLLRTNCPEEDPAKTVEMVYPTDQSRRMLQHQQERSQPAPRLPPERKASRSAYLRVFPNFSSVAHLGDVDAKQRTWRLRAAVDQIREPDPQHGRRAASPSSQQSRPGRSAPASGLPSGKINRVPPGQTGLGTPARTQIFAKM